MSHGEVRDRLGAAMDGHEGLSAAHRLCIACVEVLEVDGAAISLVHDGATQGTFGSSGERSRRLDEFQFTFGEGPCLDAVRDSRQVLVEDLRNPQEQRWPAYAGAVLEAGVRAVYALPIAVAHSYVGALDLYREAPGPLGGTDLDGGLFAAELAAVPLLEVMTSVVYGVDATDAHDGQAQLDSFDRVEVYQATGMVVAQLNVSPAEALVRLRAHAFAHGLSVSQVAWSIINRELVLEADEQWRPAGGGPGPSV